MDVATYTDLLRIARDEALANNNVLTREVIERDGTDANSVIAASAAVGDDLGGQLTQANAKLFFSTCRGNEIDLLAQDRYQGQVPRKTASPGIVTATFSLPAPPAIGFSIPQGTTLSTADGRGWVTLAQATFPTSVSFIDVPAQSVLAGSNQQIVGAPNGLTSITGSIPGAPAGLTVTNALASAGADDDEQDDDYVQRCQNFYAVSRRGILAAIEQGALMVPGVRTAKAYETDRFVELVIADAFTPVLLNATTIPASYQAQSNALAANVQAILPDWRCGGIQVLVTIANVIIEPISMLLSFRAGYDASAASNGAKAQMMAYVNGLRPGQNFVYDDAINILRLVPGLVVNGNEIISPAGDVIVTAALQVLRTDVSLITVGGQ